MHSNLIKTSYGKLHAYDVYILHNHHDHTYYQIFRSRENEVTAG